MPKNMESLIARAKIGAIVKFEKGTFASYGSREEFERGLFDEVYGHVVGFELNTFGETILAVKLPTRLEKDMINRGLLKEDENYTIHPKNVTIL